LLPITIESTSGQYGIAQISLKEMPFENSFVLADNFFKNSKVNSGERTIFLESSESLKNLRTVEEAIYKLAKMGMVRGDQLVVIGGGSLQDIGTLVSSLYMRGISWLYFPTTLAAMGDSCIGGKSSINVNEFKNMIGNFYPPKMVYIDSSLCKSLPQIERVAGLAEILKICFCHSEESFKKCLSILRDDSLFTNLQLLSELISLSLVSKQYFVENDEFDRGIRRHLNFGHSFGHALESATDYQIPHGVAVLIGMIAASLHAESEDSILVSELIEESLILLRSIDSNLISSIRSLDFNEFEVALKSDKKNTSKELNLILPNIDGLFINSGLFSEGALEKATKAMQMAQKVVENEVFRIPM
jgi:3-dehydroquinate synthase